MTQHYKAVELNPNYADIEKKILKKWDDEDIFTKSIRGEKEFVFYDGPPFANGLPHYGHLLTGYQKDLVGRYWTMKGYKVERRFGWDCHGLPAEMGAEKDLGISGKLAIEEYGINKFNDYCRTSVLRYTNEWEYYVNRQARWVDFKNDYKTMDINYMESVVWAFSELYKKGLVYKSMRVMPYSWACETPVSDFETRMDNSYREKTSKSVTAAVTLQNKPKSAPEGFDNYKVMIWTTTPWTLPSNLAIAVGADLEYACIVKDNTCFIIANDLAPSYEKAIGNNIVATISGAELVGLKYQPLFGYFKDTENAFQILAAEFVTTEDGTGLVHIAPGFGEDDFNLCAANNIPVVCPIDNGAKFLHPVEDYIGEHVFDTNDDIIKRLKESNAWIKTDQYIHNYPHCWRTDTPLIYRAIPSWYVRVSEFKDRMVKHNQEINWIPSHIKNGMFGKWIENARDWSISRNRYWGCPIPVWVSDDPKYPHTEVFGSIAEMESFFGTEVKDLHRPFIDTLTAKNPSDPTGKSKLVRVADVLDCWFESGSMPYAQVHYPFENREWFENNFPADYIVEYKAQTRGWFYTLLVLSTALFDRPPFKNVNCHGVLLGDGGQKLSKRLKNYADPKDVFETLGADALRWYMLSSTVMKGNELVIDKEASGVKDAVRRIIKPIWNAYNFFVLYANADQMQGSLIEKSDNILDNYILSKCFKAIKTVEKHMDEFDTITTTKAIEEFFDVLNNWYIRRSRERFWSEVKDDGSKQSAYNTLYTVLVLMARAAAPFLPMILEEIHGNLVQESESIHLESFPSVKAENINENLIEQMDRVRAACTSALSIRNESGVRVRQPLAKVTFIGVSSNDFSQDLQQLVLDEINVKEWENLDSSEIENFAQHKLQINFPVLGKRLPHKMKDIIVAQKKGDWQFSGGKLSILNEELKEDEYKLTLEPKENYKNIIVPLASNDGLVKLDLEITEDLKLEGIARDIIRSIQQARKDAGFEVADRIEIALKADNDDFKQVVSKWGEFIKEQTLATEIKDEIAKPSYQSSMEVVDNTIDVQLKKV